MQLLWPANGITQHAAGCACEQAMRQQRRIDQIWVFVLCAAVDCSSGNRDTAPSAKTRNQKQEQTVQPGTDLQLYLMQMGCLVQHRLPLLLCVCVGVVVGVSLSMCAHVCVCV